MNCSYKLIKNFHSQCVGDAWLRESNVSSQTWSYLKPSNIMLDHPRVSCVQLSACVPDSYEMSDAPLSELGKVITKCAVYGKKDLNDSSPS